MLEGIDRSHECPGWPSPRAGSHQAQQPLPQLDEPGVGRPVGRVGWVACVGWLGCVGWVCPVLGVCVGSLLGGLDVGPGAGGLVAVGLVEGARVGCVVDVGAVGLVVADDVLEVAGVTGGGGPGGDPGVTVRGGQAVGLRAADAEVGTAAVPACTGVGVWALERDGADALTSV